MKKLTRKDLVKNAVELIANFASHENPVNILEVEDNGDHLLSVHRTSLTDVYKIADALQVIVVLQTTANTVDYMNLYIC